MTSTTVDALKALYVALGGTAADVADLTLIPDVINALNGVAPKSDDWVDCEVKDGNKNPIAGLKAKFSPSRGIIKTKGVISIADAPMQGMSTSLCYITIPENADTSNLPEEATGAVAISTDSTSFQATGAFIKTKSGGNEIVISILPIVSSSSSVGTFVYIGSIIL
jgi:hypothetical protein